MSEAPRARRQLRRPPDRSWLDFSEVTRLVAGGSAPAWLNEFFADFTPTLWLSIEVEAVAPTRKEINEKLQRVVDAAGCLLLELRDDYVLEALASAGLVAENLEIIRLQKQLATVATHAAEGRRRLTSPDGKVKPGRGRAFSAATFPTEVYCAALIAEAWRHMRGKYPAPRTKDAQDAAALFWRLSDGDEKTHMSEPRESWRPYLRKAMQIPALPRLEEFRSDVRRHLVNAEHTHAILVVGNT